MDITALTTLLQALEHRRETEERQREERYTALIERVGLGTAPQTPAIPVMAPPKARAQKMTAEDDPDVGSEFLFRDCNPLVLLLVIPIAG
ncbi:UNVERIFIED_CONTAM: hypothetical protein FKN15_060057 [Acipenser sinensis]